MPKRIDEDWDDDSDEWTPDEDEEPKDEDEPTIPCPYCTRQIYEDSSRCPHCENYIPQQDAPPSPKPWWIIAGALLCLFFVVRWTFFGWP